MDRVTRNLRSAGWYGSVAVPMAMASPGGEARNSCLERRAIEMFDEDLALKRFRIVQLHELVGVARIAILAAEFAAAVGIDHPAEGHARTIAARQIFPRGKFEVFGLALGFERGAFGR